MQYTLALLGLAASASAIDGYFFGASSCGGNSVVCSNMNPNSCCNAPSGWNANTVGYYGIPTNWRIQGTGYSSDNCIGPASVGSSGGSSFFCLGPVGRYLRSTDYTFVGKKRAAVADSCATDAPAVGQGCQDPRNPDTLILADGAQFDIADLKDGLLNNLVCPPSAPALPWKKSANIILVRKLPRVITQVQFFPFVTPANHSEIFRLEAASNATGVADNPLEYQAFQRK